MKGKRNIIITIADFDDKIYVEYNYSPGQPAVMYLRNGDPGYPAEPAEVEVLKVSATRDGSDLCAILTDEALDSIEQECFADADCYEEPTREDFDA